MAYRTEAAELAGAQEQGGLLVLAALHGRVRLQEPALGGVLAAALALLHAARAVPRIGCTRSPHINDEHERSMYEQLYTNSALLSQRGRCMPQELHHDLTSCAGPVENMYMNLVISS